MARGAHGWPSLHICRAAGEANIDEVDRAHRGPYHELNISRYSRTRGEYCTYTWKVRNESFMVGFWSISRSFLSFFFFSRESRFARLPCRRSRSIVPFCWRMGPWLTISPVRFEACEHMAKGELLRAGVLFSSFGSRRRMAENGELESVNARFKAVEESDLKALVNGASSEATKRATSYWLRVVTAYREEKSDPIVFATCTPQECNGFLCRFYASMRPQKEGEEYRRNSYLSARAALQRHLRVVGRPFNIYTDEEFRRSNEVLNGILSERKRKGIEPSVKHKLPVTQEDIVKLQEYFSDVLEADDPIKLTQYVWFVITIHFCLRGNEVQNQLKKQDLVFEEVESNADEPSSSSTSTRHVILGTDFLSKNCRAGASGREFQSSGRITDQHQVAAIRKLLDKLHPAVPKLFQRVHPTFRPSNKVWFMKAPLGHNLLSSMMKRISVSAGLLRSYSNHCLRATSITLLQKAGFSDRMICSVSGHKNPSSLAAYNRPGKDEEKTMAAALDSMLVTPKEESSFTSAHPVSDTATVDALPGSPEGSSSRKLKNESSEAIQPLLVTGKQASFKNVTISFVQNVYPSKRGPEISSGTEEAPCKLAKKEWLFTL